jgi:hypothetical protein
MPNPSDYENEKTWMAACVPARIDEGNEQEQAVAACLSIWRERGKAMDTTATNEALTGTTDDGARGGGIQNALKALSRTDDELRVGNYLVVFGGRDLEGIASPTVNGTVFVDWEHGQDSAPGPGDMLGVVDWKTARTDERGVWVERVLNRRSQYVQWLESLIEMGLIGTSSEAVDSQVQKAMDGHITRWPLRRDTLTVTPMEPRMMTENTLQAFKALGIPVPNDTAGEPEPGAAPEADSSAVAAVKARLLRIRLKQLEEQ